MFSPYNSTPSTDAADETTPFAKAKADTMTSIDLHEDDSPDLHAILSRNRLELSLSVSRSASVYRQSASLPETNDDVTAGKTPRSLKLQAKSSRPNGVRGFISYHKKMIILNVTTFFLVGALYSFLIYSPNFVGKLGRKDIR